jgi:aldose 1-epimerase
MPISRRTMLSAAAALSAPVALSTAGQAHAAAGPHPQPEAFGALADGTEVYRWTLERGGTRMRVLSYGGIVQSLETADRHGRRANIVLGFDNLDSYVAAPTIYFGALIGRYANRIAKGRFTLDGATYQLPLNDGENSLHGGTQGFDKRVWDVEPFTTSSSSGLVLRYVSADGEMGYPGTLEAKAVYTLRDGGVWNIDYEATTDKATVVNLCNHTYWNLAGEGTGGIYDHELSIAGSRYTPIDATLIPTGELAQVHGTPFDFRGGKPIGRDIRVSDPQVLRAQGFDHNWVLDKGITPRAQHAATLRDPGSGRTVEIATTEPGLQFYSGNFLDGTLNGTSGRIYRQGDGLALETQHFPDSPNQPSFPSTVLRPGQTYRSTTQYTFGR